MKQRCVRLGIVLAGIIFGQAVLYGPSLVGKKVLLPVDILAGAGVYLSRAPEVKALPIQNVYLSDLVYEFEPARRFAVSEIHAGRVPMWAPYEFAGAPFITPKYSPLLFLEYCIASPVTLAWAQLLAALVAGLGAYLFFRRAPRLSFWPAAVAAWCYPLTGFFVFWQGSLVGLSVYWLPWLLLAVDWMVRSPGSPEPLLKDRANASGGPLRSWSRRLSGRALAPAALAFATCLVLISGDLDVAGQVLLVSGFYGLWCIHDAFPKAWFAANGGKAAARLALGWALGFMLAAPYLWPLLEYAHTGARMERRSAGVEERPPGGIKALPQVVLPDMYGQAGMMKTGSFRYTKDSQQESSAAAYAGLLAALVAAPLAFADRRRRSLNLFWTGLAFFGLGWCLNVPGLVHLLRLPGLNMMSHNRLVFVTGFGVLALAATGLEVLRKGLVGWSRWFWIALAALSGLYLWCSYRALFLPEPIATQLEQLIQQGKQAGWIRTIEELREVQAAFVQQYTVGAILCGLGVASWLLLKLRPAWQVRLLPMVAALLVAELLWFAYGREVQCDPALYFPRIPVLERVAQAPPGRVIGYKCLPACLAGMCGLRDVRGYDAVDPARYTALLARAAEPGSPEMDYARTQWLVPKVDFTSEGGVRLSPILDLLGVRYVIFRGSPAPGVRPTFQDTDYWVMTNQAALPRVFVPSRAELVADDTSRLEKLSSPKFDPRGVAYIESPVDSSEPSRGSAEVASETPTRVTVNAKMETPGLVVLTDRWDKGWRAYLNQKPVPILRVDHALRGVIVPEGSNTLEFRYEPASLRLGLGCFALAGLVLLAWTWTGCEIPSCRPSCQSR